MRRVAVLAYYFPPLGGAGVQRAAKLVQHLPGLGWEPVVVTGPATTEHRWAPRDETLGGGAVRVVRVAGPEPPRGGRAERWLRIPAEWSRWWRDGARQALASMEDVDVVVATLSPFEGARAALDAAERMGVPCVLDLRDPWALDEMFVYPSAAHRQAECRAMRKALLRADAVVMNTAEATAAVSRRWPELRGRLATVPNGFDADDLAVPPERRGDGMFRIVHTGYLHTDIARGGLRARVRTLAGGNLDGVDIGARSHLHLIEAIDRLRRELPAARRIELHLAGVLSEDDMAAAARPYVRMRDYLPHRDCVALAKSADALFLPMHDLPAGRRARIVPGKTYEYLAAGRPILAALPDGDARDLLASTGSALVVRPRDVDGLAAALRQLLGGAGPSGAGDPTVLASYERLAIARAFAGVLESVAAGQARALAA